MAARCKAELAIARTATYCYLTIFRDRSVGVVSSDSRVTVHREGVAKNTLLFALLLM